MHTLLLRPPPRRSGSRGLLVPPLGLAYLAASLEEAGRGVTLLDAWGEGLTWGETKGRIQSLKPDILGLGAMTPVADVAAEAARYFRDDVGHILLGGPHPTALGVKALDAIPEVDSLIIGEGELTLPRWISAIESKDLHTPMAGVITRNWHGGEGPQPDLDSLPFPARHLLPNHRYRYPLATRGPITTMITSRGCPFSCSFCDQSVTGRQFRARSPEGVVEELARLEAEGFGFVCFYDDVFTLDRKRALAICDEIQRRGVNIHWKCEARVDCVDETLLGEMSRAGCKMIAFGLETINQVGLDALQKESTPEDARRAFTMAKRQGLETLAYVLFGIPGETREDAHRTLDFCDEVGVSVVQFATLAPTPGTALFAQAEGEGWPFADVRGPFDDDLARPAVVPPGWSEEDLRELMSHALKRYYLKPSFLARQALRAARGGQLRVQLRDGLRHAYHTLRAVGV